ncbi:MULTISPECIES: TOMM precursor leader peptide-binding protein [unclassified Streptomyces]|uniref:TOMM precursor leader peptide-binding protein n=1 Tax=unclassified Streptomyces TaxID=2593676 RepID=UPI00380E89FD
MATGETYNEGPGPDDGTRLGFKSHLRPTVIPGEAAYLVSHRGVTALRGEPAEVLVPLLDGSRSPAAVVREAAASLSGEEALAALAALDAAGLLRLRPAPAGRRPDPAAEAYWDLAGLDGGEVAAHLARRCVHVVALQGLDADEAREACRACGLTVARSDDVRDEADLTLVLCDDYLSPQLADIDAEHRASRRPWLLARAGSTACWVGPVFRHREGPCWHCLTSRLRDHRRSEEPLRHALGLAGPPGRPPATLPAGRSLTVQLAVLEAAKWLAGLRVDTQSCVHAFDTIGLRSTSHPVTRRPQCHACGDPALVARRVSRPFVPRPCPKAAQALNGHRALTPARMLERCAPLVDPVTGIVREIRRAPRSPEFVHTFLSGENLAMRSPTLAGLRAGLRSLSGGKGLTETEARTSALGEAVERYSGTRQGDEPVIRDSYRALGTAAVHPNSSQLYDERQLRERARWNARRSRLQYVPPPFDVGLPTEWTPVWSLTGKTQRLLPTSMLYFSEQAAPDGLFADSNGNAAGSSPEDALVQGFLELVERDAVALWWYNRTRQPAIDLDAFAEPYIGQLLDGYGTLSREVWALDLTSDFGIPVVAALSRRTDKPAQDIVFGFGAHFDPRIALRRALTEMGQLLPLVRDVTPDGIGYLVDDADALDWWRRATSDGRPYLTADPALPRRGPDDWVYTPNTDLGDDVAAITEAVRSRGMDLLVLDQTRPDLDIPVVKVIVPGMRHFWPRFAPGRLYTTPVMLGRRSEPTPFEDLNPTPLFV